ncbi:MAG: hypothetical protein JWN34_361 [Bryobacterales bacterium]|nr:hypothetical protein [Bryobacterales bacterium]
MSDASFYQWLLAGSAALIGLAVIIIGYFLNRHLDDYRDHKDDDDARHQGLTIIMNQHEKSLLEVRLDVSENYAKKANVEAQVSDLKNTMQNGFLEGRQDMRRLGDKLDAYLTKNN